MKKIIFYIFFFLPLLLLAQEESTFCNKMLDSAKTALAANKYNSARAYCEAALMLCKPDSFSFMNRKIDEAIENQKKQAQALYIASDSRVYDPQTKVQLLKEAVRLYPENYVAYKELYSTLYDEVGNNHLHNLAQSRVNLDSLDLSKRFSEGVEIMDISHENNFVILGIGYEDYRPNTYYWDTDSSLYVYSIANAKVIPLKTHSSEKLVRLSGNCKFTKDTKQILGMFFKPLNIYSDNHNLHIYFWDIEGNLRHIIKTRGASNPKLIHFSPNNIAIISRSIIADTSISEGEIVARIPTLKFDSLSQDKKDSLYSHYVVNRAYSMWVVMEKIINTTYLPTDTLIFTMINQISHQQTEKIFVNDSIQPSEIISFKDSVVKFLYEQNGKSYYGFWNIKTNGIKSIEKIERLEERDSRCENHLYTYQFNLDENYSIDCEECVIEGNHYNIFSVYYNDSLLRTYNTVNKFGYNNFLSQHSIFYDTLRKIIALPVRDYDFKPNILLINMVDTIINLIPTIDFSNNPMMLTQKNLTHIYMYDYDDRSKLYIYNIVGGNKNAKPEKVIHFENTFKEIRISEDEKIIVVLDYHNNLMLYDLQKEVNYIWKDEGEIISYRTDEKKQDNYYHILIDNFDVIVKDTLENFIKRINTHAQVYNVEISPDKKYLLVASYANEGKLYEINTGKQIKSFPHSNDINTAIFSKDGKYILTGSSDSKAKLWDMEGNLIIERDCSNPVLDISYWGGDEYCIFCMNMDSCQMIIWNIYDNTVKYWE